MNNSIIDNTNISPAVEFLLKINSEAFELSFEAQAKTLIESLKIGWQAYNFTQVNFSQGKTAINISDNYLQALINTANAVYTLLNNDSKEKLQAYIKEDIRWVEKSQKAKSLK